MRPYIILSIVILLFEATLAIPVIGGVIVISSGYTVIGLMLALHIANLVLRIIDGQSKFTPIFGIVLTLLTWIPVIGWLVHCALAITYLIDVIVYFNRSRTINS